MSYKDTVLPIMRLTRDILLPNFGNIGFTEDEESKYPFHIITEVDKNVEGFLKKKLNELYPNIQFVGEEEGGNRNAENFWLVDPIDGTGHYMRGLPFCTVMLALIEKGSVTFSAIYDFLNDDLYWAEKGKGAYKNDIPIHVSNRSLHESYICIETKIFNKKNQPFLGEINKEGGTFSSISAGWEFAMIACGKLDGRIGFDPHGKDYDYAPGCLLVAEAGGIVTNINSNIYDYTKTNIIAANPKVYESLKTIFEDY